MQAKLALDHFILGLRRAIGSMCGVLGGADALIFTGGIGERRALVRYALAAAIPGCVLDESANERACGDAVISAATFLRR
ncbi:hypothetical protein [Nevskia sp.]|uniref:hypothetical protein n=1 Tax=Nevskia sp. TaxID=1929292 RepID=UPI0025F44D59|nr:hypothetical protein [Nevskia sp.]